jgi:cytochrome c oxidase subunit 2
MVVLMRTLLLAACAVALVSASARSWMVGRAQGAPAGQTVDVVAERFSFTPSEIRTTVGTTLTIRLTSDDTAHGFRIVGSGVDIEIPKRSRGTATVTFTPEKAGRYAFRCSRLCGAGHSFMRGVIIAGDAPSGGGPSGSPASRVGATLQGRPPTDRP